MWAKNGGADNVLKESLLRQLSQTVKEVQLYHSQTREICTTQEGTSSLVTVLEAILLHALKRSLLESALRSVSVTDDAKPAPSFYEAVKSVTHKDTVAQIRKLQRISTDVGRSRVWVRLALNEGSVSSYLAALAADRRLSRFYRPAAFLRDREALDTAARLLEGLLSVRFDIPLNSSLLNTWTSEPLLLSGVWAPAMRATVQMAVDVAGGIEDEETCSVLTASSSVRSLLTLDEAQAIQIIMDTPMLSEENELPEELPNEAVDREMERLEKEREEILSYSCLIESCSPKVEAQFPSSLTEPHEEDVPAESDTEKTEAGMEEEVIARPVQTKRDKKFDEDYSAILPKDAKNLEEECDNLLKNKYGQTEETKEAEKPSIEKIVMRIPRERGLRAQRFECSDCQLSISLNFGPAFLCHVTGEYLCENCHKGEMGVVPSRVVFNWDHTKYPIGIKATTYLATLNSEPAFDITILNPKLYNAVPEMRDILKLRRQLNLLNLYLATCKTESSLPIRSYIYENPNLFSFSDLTSVPNGILKSELEKSVAFGRSHVLSCWICKEKGFICEFCKNPQVIYPFDAGSIYRCSKCKAVYHGNCLGDGRNCPKCKRRKQRAMDGS